MSQAKNTAVLSKVGMNPGGRPNRIADNFERLVAKRPEVVETLPSGIIEQFSGIKAEKITADGEKVVVTYMDRINALANTFKNSNKA